MSERSEIVPGGIYIHCGDSTHQYEMIGVYPDATHFEETGQTPWETLLYRQLYDGNYPKGTVWTREREDFCSETTINGRQIKKFKLIREPKGLALPDFSPGRVVKETANYRVVTDWKLGLENQPAGERFFIEPKTDRAEEMLFSAAQAHNIPNLNPRFVTSGSEESERLCLRADFSVENLRPIFFRETIVPKEGKDSVPSPDRMEECLEQGHDYSFEDRVLPISQEFMSNNNIQIVHLRPDSWQVLRDIKIKSTMEEPIAFEDQKPGLERYLKRTEAEWRDKLDEEKSRTVSVFAKDGEKYVGMVSGVIKNAVFAEIQHMYVDSEHRNQKIGGKLLDALLFELREKGVEIAILYVVESQTSARFLYKSRGFIEIGTEPAERGKESVTEIIMAVVL